MKPIDIFILCFKRVQYTQKTLEYLFERTAYPMRVFVLIQDDDLETEMMVRKEFGDKVFMRVKFSQNVGISPAWNVAAALAESEYFITSDNDIYVPDLRDRILKKGNNYTVTTKQPDWLERLVGFMESDSTWGAISLHPHVFIGAAGIDPEDEEAVKERNMCGGVMRIMRRDAVIKAGGWEREIKTGRGTEERTICSRLQAIGYRTGICSRIRAYHPFGADIPNNTGWGYQGISPEDQGHNPVLKDEVLRFDNPDAYDNKTWLPK